MSRSLSPILSLIILFTLTASAHAADIEVRKVDFLREAGLEVNGAGPVLVRADRARGRMIAFNTLSPSVSVIDCATGGVRNIPVGGRAF
ncbi:MAG TPA: hypothetical protein VLA34_02590, partial [Candidatus Krumholzibacterium sp.]|nr:hypothetical protein [Candidatus Krumholzibacterium sp.]